MLLATSEFFPAWMLWLSLMFSAAAAGLFIYGDRRRKLARPKMVAPKVTASDVPAPPMPLVAVATEALSEDDPNSKRRTGFRRVGNPVEVIVFDEEFKSEPRRGWVVDRSRQGLRISLLEKVEAGTVLQVHPTKSSNENLWVTVEVRNATPAAQSTWELGCKFTMQPPWEVVLMFG